MQKQLRPSQSSPADATSNQPMRSRIIHRERKFMLIQQKKQPPVCYVYNKGKTSEQK